MLQNITLKFPKPGDLVLYACCGMVASGLACLLQQQHRRFMAYERDQDCVAEGMPSLAETFSMQLLDKFSYLTVSEDVLRGSKTLVAASDVIAVKKQPDV